MEVPRGKKFEYVYPVTLIVGTFIQWTGIFSFARDWYFIQSKNFVNKIFAGNAYLFLLLILISSLFLQILDQYNTPMLPLNYTNIKKESSLNTFILKRVIKIILVFVDLNLILNYQVGLFNVWQRWTQSCSDPLYTTAEQCSAHQGVWDKGFDPSGHYFLLITTSLITIDELIKLTPLDPKKYHKQIYNTLNRYVVYLGVTMIGIWYCLFVVTSIFYHTLWEKVVGFGVGFSIASAINLV